jgi:hypothetical protein
MTSGLQNAINKALEKQGVKVKFTGDSFRDVVVDVGPNKSPKYNVAPKEDRTYGGLVFDSRGEMQRYLDLELLERAGSIKDLKIQPEFTLQEGYREKNGMYVKPIKYIADFSYYENKKFIVEDFKGHETSIYKMKKKMFLKKYSSFEFGQSGQNDI